MFLDFLSTIIFKRGIPIKWIQPVWLRREGATSNLIGLGGTVESDNESSSDISNFWKDLAYLCNCCCCKRDAVKTGIEEIDLFDEDYESKVYTNDESCCPRLRKALDKAYYSNAQPFDWV